MFDRQQRGRKRQAMRGVVAHFVTVMVIASFGMASDHITTRDDVVGQLLNQWAAEKRTAGLSALRYENRDGDHSVFDLSLYPGLKRYAPSAEETKGNRHIGPAHAVRAFPMLGNCSMASPANLGGSLPRIYLTAHPTGSLFLTQQYLNNNLIIYPEHQDHDVGFNGVDGWGDLFPANHPALLITQGSSFSDIPILRAWFTAAAALRPDVQEMLIRNKILIPTLNALFRKSNKQVQTDADYFTGKAHPVVFEGAHIDELKLVNAAQLLSELSVPPVALLELLSERTARPNVDFFERPDLTEKLSDSPVNVSRIFRSTAEVYEMKLSARRSRDLQSKPLKFRWVLLQGNPQRVQILPSDDGLEVTLRVRWQPSFSSPANPALTTHRVDIGLFASSPVADSAPAIISFYMLPNEMRFFDDQGRLKEVCYQAGNPDAGIPRADDDLRWWHFMELVTGSVGGAGSEWVGRHVTDAQRKTVASSMANLRPKRATMLALQGDEQRKVDAAKLEAEIKTMLRTAVTGVEGLRSLASTVVGALAGDAELFLNHSSAWLAADSSGALAQKVKRLVDWGVLIPQDGGTYSTAVPRQAWGEAEHWYLTQLNLTVLGSALLPKFLQRSPLPAFVDPRLTAIKPWRDVYRYDAEGTPLGWVRHHEGKVLRFTAEGHLKPALGSGISEALPMIYQEDTGRLIWRPAKSGR
jgi:hypothetical protein